jgi:hypothetical protein
MMKSVLGLFLLLVPGLSSVISNINDINTLKVLFKLALAASKDLITPNIITHLEYILECDNLLSFEGSTKDLFLDDLKILKHKFVHINELQTIIKRKEQFGQLIRLFRLGLDYLNKLLFDMKAEFIKNNPGCSLRELMIFQESHPLHNSCYRFAYYSLLYIAYFQFVLDEPEVYTTPNNFVFSKLTFQLSISQKYYSENPGNKKYQKRAKNLVVLLQDLVSFRYRYDSQIILMLPPSENTAAISAKILSIYNKRLLYFDAIIHKLSGS